MTHLAVTIVSVILPFQPFVKKKEITSTKTGFILLTR
jgi:hypothetical protein